MRIYNGFMLFIATMVFITLGICLICVRAGVLIVDSFLHENASWVLGAGVLFVIMGITEIIVTMKSLGRIPVVAFNNPLGEVRVAYDALEGYIKSLSGEIPEIKDVKPQIVAGRDGLEIHARLAVERDVNLPELTSRFQDLVSRYVKDMMGIDNITTIKVYIQKITSKRSRTLEEEKPSEGDTEKI